MINLIGLINCVTFFVLNVICSILVVCKEVEVEVKVLAVRHE